jgi:DNA polymerase elongation subunit (family B)
MKELSFQDLDVLIRNNELSFFNIYNSDISIQSQATAQYYLQHQYDTIDIAQLPSIYFTDIELFHDNKEPEPFKDGKSVINAITVSNSKYKKIKSYLFLIDRNFKKFGIISDSNFNFDNFIKERQNKYLKQLVENKYLTEDFEIEINVFNDELIMIKKFWEDLHTDDPFIATGWYSDSFDYPYLYNRTVNLIGTKVQANQIVSKFGYIEEFNGLIRIPDITIADLLYLYKPRDEGGLNLGRKRSQYTLDFIAEQELGLKKLEYKEANITLDNLYLNDPETFLLYNIIDVILVRKLNDKLRHINLQNMMRRVLRTSFGGSLVGSSNTFDTFVFSKLLESNKYVRYGIKREMSKSIDEEQVKPFPIPQSKKWAIKPVSISAKQYQAITTKYPGAFVKSPVPTIINDGSIIIDLDASALYPSSILQYNISFDSYRARILSTCTYKTIELLNNVLGKTNFPDALSSSLFKMCVDYVNNKDITKKAQTITELYYIMMHLFETLYKSNLPLSDITNPKTDFSCILLKTYLIPLLDIINLIHPANNDYIQFVYDYIFMDPDKLKNTYQYLYIIHNINSPKINIQQHSLNETLQFIKSYILTLAGTLFTKHEDQTGLFTDFLNQTGNLRKIYQRKMLEFHEDSEEYHFNDSRQKSIKVVRNTSYGLYGMSGFRYSDNWLAQSITNQAMLTTKTAQYLAEKHLDFKFGK